MGYRSGPGTSGDVTFGDTTADEVKVAGDLHLGGDATYLKGVRGGTALSNPCTVITTETMANTDFSAGWTIGAVTLGGNFETGAITITESTCDDAVPMWVINTTPNPSTLTFTWNDDCDPEDPEDPVDAGYSYASQTIAVANAANTTDLQASTWYKFSCFVAETAPFAQADDSSITFAMSFAGGIVDINGWPPNADPAPNPPITAASATSRTAVSGYFKTPSNLTTGGPSASSATGSPYELKFVADHHDASESQGTYVIDTPSILDATLVTSVGHGLSASDLVALPTGADEALEVYTVATVATDYFTIDRAASNTIVGKTGYSAPTILDIVSKDGTGNAAPVLQADGTNVAIGLGASAATRTVAAAGTTAVGAFAGAAITSGEKNTAVGYQALKSEDDGDHNTAVGYQALTAQTGVTGNVKNTAIGSLAGDALLTGTDNVFVGAGAGGATTTVDDAVIIGSNAGAANMVSVCDGTVAIGANALQNLTNGNNNIAIGPNALQSLISADNNIAIGAQALSSMTIGDFAFATITVSAHGSIVGTNSSPNDGFTLYDYAGTAHAFLFETDTDTVGTGNRIGIDTPNSNNDVATRLAAAINAGSCASTITAEAYSADVYLWLDTPGDGFAGTANVDDIPTGVAVGQFSYWSMRGKNIGIGYMAGLRVNGLYTTSDGVKNTLVGNRAGEAMELGSGNTFIGDNAGQGDRDDADNYLDGDDNTAVGRSAGESMITTATYNTLIGANAGNTITTGTGNVMVGYNTDCTTATHLNQIAIGNGVVTNASDLLKIGDAANSLTFDFSSGGGTISTDSDERMKKNITDTDLGLDFVNALRPIKYVSKNEFDYPDEFGVPKDGPRPPDPVTVQDGLLAQEVKSVIDNMGVTFSAWSEEEATTRQRLEYTKLVIPLIKAVQELSAKVAELEAKLEN